MDEAKQESKYLNIYSEEDFQRKIEIIDTFCINETKRAEKDIQKGKLSLNTSYLYNLDRPLQNEKHINYEVMLTPHLEKFKIRLDTTLMMSSDIIMPFDDLFGMYCYQKKMKDEIEKRYGQYFIDSLVDVVEKEYELKHGNKTVFDKSVSNYERIEQELNYEDYISKYEAEFEKQFTYPKDYKLKNEKKYSYSNAEFILRKDGTIRNLKIRSVFVNPYNQKFKTYFEDGLRKFVVKTKWELPRVPGRRVNNEMSLIIFHK
jgi:hypothetical protein